MQGAKISNCAFVYIVSLFVKVSKNQFNVYLPYSLRANLSKTTTAICSNKIQ